MSFLFWAMGNTPLHKERKSPSSEKLLFAIQLYSIVTNSHRLNTVLIMLSSQSMLKLKIRHDAKLFSLAILSLWHACYMENYRIIPGVLYFPPDITCIFILTPK